MFYQRLECPACNAVGEVRFSTSYAELSPFLSDYYRRQVQIDGEYIVRECDCGTFYQEQIPDDEILGQVYGDWIDPIDQPIGERDLGEIRTVVRHLGKKRLRTLDWGMGDGEWARAAVQASHDSHGIDLAEAKMETARQAGVKNTTDGKFDFINTEQVMEHLAHPGKIVEELASKLLPDGVLKVSVPSNKGVSELLAGLRAGKPMDRGITPVHPLEHLNCFSREGLNILAKRNGLTPVRPSLLNQLLAAHKSPRELVRPFVRWNYPTNIYAWFAKA